jgi:2-keto-4-pentenoate hydratase
MEGDSAAPRNGAGRLAGAACVIELAETRLASWNEAPALWKLADFQSNGVLVAGTGTASWREIDFGAQTVELQINGKAERRATGAHPSGDPSRLLPWLIGHVADRGGLRAGDIVTTGSWIGIVRVQRGDDVVARFPGIGEARLRL